MTLIAHPVAGKAKSRDLCEAFIKGAPKGAEGHVFAGIMPNNIATWRRVLKNDETYYYIDGSYFDCMRELQFRITKNSVQHSGLGKSDGRRFKALGVGIKPWVDRPDGLVVFVEQSANFMRDVAEDPDWWSKTNARYKLGPTLVRAWAPNKLKLQSTLVEDLKNARLLVTHTSAAAITALLEGVPVLTSDMSPASSVCAWEVEGPDYDNRKEVLSVLADNQFTRSEMQSGEAWVWLNR